MSDFATFEERLENWGRVVRSPRYQSGVCAVWARWFVSTRNSIEDDKSAPVASIPPVDKDGWIVERAWAHMPDDVHKWVLKYEFVWRMSSEQVQTRLRKNHKIILRGRNWDLVTAEARAAIKKFLVNTAQFDKLMARLPNPLTRELLDAPWQAGVSGEQMD